MTANDAAGQRTARCRFCGRAPRPGQHRVPGPAGPICTDCVQAGLRLVHDGVLRTSEGGSVLAPVRSLAAYVCEYCGRREHRTFLGFRRPLARMSCEQFGAVICVDCLDRAGDLLNSAYRR